MSFIIWNEVVVPPRVESIEGPGQFKTEGLPDLSSEDANQIRNSWANTFGTSIQIHNLEALFDYFFAQFFSYVSEGFYLERDPDFVSGANSFMRKDFFNSKFSSSLIEWGKSLTTAQRNPLAIWNQNDLMDHVNRFALFMESSNAEVIQRIREVQENVILYCIDRLIEAMQSTQETEHRYSLDLIKHYEAMIKAQKGLNGIELPVVKPSVIDGRIPDPTSVGAQQLALLEREQKRQSFNLSKDEARQVETNLQFAKENSNQFSTNFISLFERQKTMIEVLIRL